MTDEEKQPWLDVPIAGLISRGTFAGWLVALSLMAYVAILIAKLEARPAFPIYIETLAGVATFVFFLAIWQAVQEVKQNLQSRKRNKQHEEEDNE